MVNEFVREIDDVQMGRRRRTDTTDREIERGKALQHGDKTHIE